MKFTSVWFIGALMTISAVAYTQPTYDPECYAKAQYAQDAQRCNQIRHQHFDRILNQSYQALLKKQSKTGQKSLRQIQRAWLQERDDVCHELVAKAVVSAGQIGDACFADWTEERALTMRVWLQKNKRF
ncbi:MULTISPECIES: lysozyme inhibitor LprI family protein [Vitreoscilla]|uniref:Lysozyme inhibitor LprI family protein n=1 Tax=Vitreoscilla stercoraria TaxID=61 RepID=A0ABY4EDK0_VITST|nr:MULTISPECIES: lysozyme inhibitor LprI family protein [Vitreoscilla]AUZ04836.1 hypothetical protein ADP71_11830 [Vitreoscilla sp. C1]UOO91497.1 lysozyme inhibitor LprI family protein [Vitreoscilla stercoraria]